MRRDSVLRCTDRQNSRLVGTIKSRHSAPTLFSTCLFQDRSAWILKSSRDMRGEKRMIREPRRPTSLCKPLNVQLQHVSAVDRRRIMGFSFLCGMRRSVLPEPGHRAEVHVKTKLPLSLRISTAVRRSGTHGFATRGLFPAASNKYSTCDSTSLRFYDKAPVLV